MCSAQRGGIASRTISQDAWPNQCNQAPQATNTTKAFQTITFLDASQFGEEGVTMLVCMSHLMGFSLASS